MIENKVRCPCPRLRNVFYYCLYYSLEIKNDKKQGALSLSQTKPKRKVKMTHYIKNN